MLIYFFNYFTYSLLYLHIRSIYSGAIIIIIIIIIRWCIIIVINNNIAYYYTPMYMIHTRV